MKNNYEIYRIVSEYSDGNIQLEYVDLFECELEALQCVPDIIRDYNGKFTIIKTYNSK